MRLHPNREREWDIDVVVPVPDGSRPAAIQVSAELGLPYREGLVKNRYVGRTFIMPDQRMREMSVRRKLNAMPAVFRDKNVLLIDDSIVRGTTMAQIVDMVRKAGAKKVSVCVGCLWWCEWWLGTQARGDGTGGWGHALSCNHRGHAALAHSNCQQHDQSMTLQIA